MYCVNMIQAYTTQNRVCKSGSPGGGICEEAVRPIQRGSQLACHVVSPATKPKGHYYGQSKAHANMNSRVEAGGDLHTAYAYAYHLWLKTCVYHVFWLKIYLVAHVRHKSGTNWSCPFTVRGSPPLSPF